jgi:hypothetical protein
VLGRKVTPDPVTRPISAPAKDGTIGAEITGVTMESAETSTAKAVLSPSLPSSGTGTVPAVSQLAAPNASPADAQTDSTPITTTSTVSLDSYPAAAEQVAGSRAESMAPDRSSDPREGGANPASQNLFTTTHVLGAQEPVAETNEVAPTAPAPSVTLERLEAQLRERVVEFRDRRADALSVVLRPEPGTELHLQLQLRDNRVEVIATCARGDAAGLQTHWHQLQQSLAGQGVRLAGLETGLGQGAPRRDPAPPAPDSAPSPAHTLSRPTAISAAPSSRTSSRRLLESWA